MFARAKVLFSGDFLLFVTNNIAFRSRHRQVTSRIQGELVLSGQRRSVETEVAARLEADVLPAQAAANGVTAFFLEDAGLVGGLAKESAGFAGALAGLVNELGGVPGREGNVIPRLQAEITQGINPGSPGR